MGASAVLIDANVLVLLVVGLTSPALIREHKRLRRYDEAAYDLLAERLGRASRVIVTPNVTTEASNLLSRGTLKLRDETMTTFAVLLRSLGTPTLAETYVPSNTATERREFIRLGLTDAAILTLERQGAVLLTDDLDLYLAAERMGQPAEYFTYLRQAAGQID